MKYQIDLGQAANLLLVGQNVPYSHLIGAYDAATGAPHPGFPVITDDYQFLSSSTIASVGSGAAPTRCSPGTGLGLLHAYDGATGRDAAGFPKVTGGWLFAPAALSDDGRMAGHHARGLAVRVEQPGAPACQTEWPAFRHDQQGSGNYDADGTPPAAPERHRADAARRRRLPPHASRSPGDDGFCGTAERYARRSAGSRSTSARRCAAATGSRRTSGSRAARAGSSCRRRTTPATAAARLGDRGG